MTSCPLCGFYFDENESRLACSSCYLGKLSDDCGFVRCPNCSYEMPQEPKIVKRIKAWRNRRRVGTSIH